MSVPKKRRTSSSKRRRQSHDSLKMQSVVSVKDTARSHRVQPSRRTKQGRDTFAKRASRSS